MSLRKLLLMLPLLLFLGTTACDNDNSSNAQDMEPDPAPVQAKTTVTGKVIPPGSDSCNGMFPGFMDGDDVEIDVNSNGGPSGTATIMVNQGTDGMIACSADGTGLEIVDSPPISNIICEVTSVSSEFTGVSNGDLLQFAVFFSGESPVQKQAVVIVMDQCAVIGIENLNANSS